MCNLGRFSSGTRAASGDTLGKRYPCCQTYNSLPSVYPCRAQLGREDGRAWSGPYVKAIKSDKVQRRQTSRSIADVLYRDTCEKGLGGHHTSSRMSSDSHRRGELRGLIGKVDGIYNPPTEGLFGSRKTYLRGNIAYQQLVHPSPQGSSVDVCIQCSPSRADSACLAPKQTTHRLCVSPADM